MLDKGAIQKPIDQKNHFSATSFVSCIKERWWPETTFKFEGIKQMYPLPVLKEDYIC